MARDYPFIGGVGPNQFQQGFVYRMDDYEWHDYDRTSKAIILSLIRSLDKDGPFYADYYVRDSHTDSSSILTTAGNCIKEGENLLCHAVSIVGCDLMWVESEGMWRGYWKALDSDGVNTDNKGMSKLSVDLIDDVFLPKVNLSTCESYYAAAPSDSGSD